MFDLGEPWAELIVRGLLVYLALMVLVRLSGKRTVGEFTPFDLVVVILLGESVQGSLTGSDESLQGGLLLAATLVGTNWAVGFVSARSRGFDTFVEGDPVVLVRNGRLDRRAMRKNNIPESDLDEAIRKHDLRSRDDVGLAVLEVDGEITVLKRRKGRKDTSQR